MKPTSSTMEVSEKMREMRIAVRVVVLMSFTLRKPTLVDKINVDFRVGCKSESRDIYKVAAVTHQKYHEVPFRDERLEKTVHGLLLINPSFTRGPLRNQ